MNPNTPPQSTGEHSGKHRSVAAATAAGLLTSTLVASHYPYPELPDGRPGGTSTGVLHPGTPDQPGATIRTEHSTTKTRSFSVPFSQEPGSSVIDSGDRKKLDTIPKKIEWLQDKGFVVTGVEAKGRSSSYTADPDSLPVRESETKKPQQDWSRDRAEALSKELDDIIARSGLKNVPKAREKTAQDVLNSEEMKRFTRIAKDAGYLGKYAAHTATGDVLWGSANNSAIKKAVEKYVTSQMGGTATVVAERTDTTFDITREPDIPGTPGEEIVSYNEPPAVLPEIIKGPILRGKNPRIDAPKTIGDTRKGNATELQRIKQPRFGKEKYSKKSKSNSGNQGRRGHNLRGGR